MNSALQDSLVITGIGMGMVFLAILFLWGLMEALVRLFPARISSTVVPATEMPVFQNSWEPNKDQQEIKSMVAALAVAAALTLKSQSSPKIGTKNTNELSPWQLAMRVDSIQQQHAMGTRKSKGVAGNENSS